MSSKKDSFNHWAGNKELKDIKEKLDSVSPSMCLAKWLQVSLHLTTGQTHSCYHPPVHGIDKEEILKDPLALHNTQQKKEERRQMLKGEKPKGCSYCWNIESAGNHYSDRHYRSLEPWALNSFKEALKAGSEQSITPTYVEVNFNQACQFKCSYCSPHLSTTWMEEIKKYGHYPTLVPHNNISELKKKNLWPIPINEANPYVEAFWRWWPQLYPKLKVFRMTGGEPLIDPNSYRVLDFIKENPNPELELAITSNLCPPKKMMNKFQSSIKEILSQNKIFRFMIFPSIDTWGRQADYIRYGLDHKEFEANVRNLIKEVPELLMSFIVTVNALSPFSLKALLEKFLEWQKEVYYLYKCRHIRLFFDLPFLRSPAWQCLSVLPEGLARPYFERCLHFMESNPSDVSKGKYYGFSNFQINKMKRLIALSDQKINPQTKIKNQRDFYRFFNEHDKRRQTHILEIFPELESFWLHCKKQNAGWRGKKN